MHRDLVDRLRWIDDAAFLRALNFCMLLPGPEAQQLATYIGWRLHGVAGGIAAGSLFVLPSIGVLLFLSWLVATQSRWPVVAGMLYGVQPVVVAIVADALIKIGHRVLHRPIQFGLAAAAFAALFFFSAPFPAVIGCAALAGAIAGRVGAPPAMPPAPAAPAGDPAEAGGRPGPRPALVRVAKVVGLCVLLWAIPVGALWFVRGPDDVIVRQAFFFTRAAFVTFGGAYAVLTYVADAAVNRFGWLGAPQMVQGLGLAESTPGPLIMVVQFVGFMGAWNLAPGGPRLPVAILAALVTTFVTFLPSFMFIFAGAPFIERLTGQRRIQDALSGILSAVVGVILNLTVFFAARVLAPIPGGPDRFAIVAAIIAFAILRWTSIPMPALLGLGGLAGLVRALAL
jgi:chromate transporter